MRVLTAVLLLSVCLAAAAPDIRTQRITARRGAVAAPFAFRAAGLYPTPGTDAVRVRASSDGINWTGWIDAQREDTGAGALAFFDAPQRWLEIDADASVLFIDPGESAQVVTAKPPASRLALEAPKVVSRAEWGCPPETCYFRGGSPSYTTVTHLIVHHTAGANTASDWTAVMRSIWALHVNGNGWSDIGYNYLIDPNGVLYEGRQGGDGVIGAHFSGVNSGTMGVSVMGTYSTLRPPGAALQTLTGMLAWHADKWKLDPAADAMHTSSQLRLNVVSGHRDAGLSPRASGTTECPGNGLYVLLPAIRRDVQSILVENGNTFTNAAATCEQGVPCVAPHGIVTAGSRDGLPVVAGSWISILGTNLAPAASEAPAGTLPAELGGVSVTVNGSRTAPLLFVSPAQINAQLPSGVNTGSARLVVTVDGRPGPERLFWITEAAPSIFVAQNHEDGKVNGPEATVRAGGALVVYLTGGGAVNGTFPSPGTPAPAQPLLAATAPWTASVGGRSAARLFLGLVPGCVGLYQANIVIPPDTPAGLHDLLVTVAGASSMPLPVYVRRD